MEAILKFNLNSPDDSLAHQRCFKALSMQLLLEDLDSFLRSYKHRDLTEDQHKIIEEVKNKFYTSLSEYELTNLI